MGLINPLVRSGSCHAIKKGENTLPYQVDGWINQQQQQVGEEEGNVKYKETCSRRVNEMESDRSNPLTGYFLFSA